MKKITLLLVVLAATFLFGVVASADPTEPQWVSTDVQKKNVVLEEYTGWQCQFCPDGHKRAADLAKANPGRIFLVNIHAGGYAAPVPSVYGWDLRTSEGTTLAGASGLTGYPAGTVNRAKTPWASDRGRWANEAATILSQNSPVNVFTKASIDLNTRKLIVEVEVYYTESSSTSTNKLSVVLLQNEIIGAQVDSGPFYKEMHVKDLNPSQALYLYRHQHALRKFISDGGAYGEDITQTTKDSYIYKKYELDVPSTIIETNIPVELSNLEVLAFVAEGNGNIYTGHKADIEYIGEYTDLSIEDISTYPSTLQLTSFAPKAEIINNKGLAVTSFDVNFYANEELVETKTFNGNLEAGQSTTIEFSDFNFTKGGIVSFDFEVTSPKNADGEVYDLHASNNFAGSTVAGLISQAIITDTLGFDGEMPENTLFITNENPGFSIVASSSGAIGANNTIGAVRYAIHSSWGLAGKPGYILFGEVDFENVPNKTLSYYYAYSDGSQNGSAPKIIVEVSEDWGATWVKESEITCESTGEPSNPQYYYVPTSAEYKRVEVDLSKYANKNALIRVAGIPGSSGNALYIDEIALYHNTSRIEENRTLLTVYPNPATTILNLDNESLLGLDYEIYDAAGKLVLKSNNNTNIINVDGLLTGAYTLRINGENLPFIKK